MRVAQKNRSAIGSFFDNHYKIANATHENRINNPIFSKIILEKKGLIWHSRIGVELHIRPTASTRISPIIFLIES